MRLLNKKDSGRCDVLSHFSELLQYPLLRNGGHVVAVIQAYFDESGTDDGSKFLCVAGYIFEKEKAIAMDAEWQAMLIKYFEGGPGDQ